MPDTSPVGATIAKTPFIDGGCGTVLVRAIFLSARTRARVSDRVRGGSESVSSAARRARIAPGSAVRETGGVSRDAEFVFLVADRSGIRHLCVAGCRAIDAGVEWLV